MEHVEFDERYPAIFQPGGDELPRTAHTAAAPIFAPPATTPQTTNEPAPLIQAPARPLVAPTVSAPPVPVSRAVRVAPAHERFVPEQAPLPPAGQPAPAVQAAHVSPATSDAVDAGEGTASHPAAGLPGETGTQAQPDEILPGARRIHWSTRSWVVGMGAGLLAIAAGVFCLFAAVLIPSSRSVAGDGSDGMRMVTWVTFLTSVAPSLVIAGLGMVAAMFIVGSRHYTARARWLWAGAAVVGVIATVGAVLAMFSPNLFAKYMYFEAESGGYSSSSLMMLMYSAMQPLTVFGLSVLAVVAIVRPGASRAGAVASGPAALLAGGMLLVGAVVALFAPQLFPRSMSSTTQTMGDMTFSTIPWPTIVSGSGSSVALVGAGIFLWGVLIQATSRRVYAEDPNDELEAEPAA
ncbi:hypothetical protein AL755_19410 [Arthrobacter sp. ERGS1:01]|uniref:hypothetical protein n=1 Tax=Arthrobacter sp. ERGS1:01 TaxID=1704044 RepID=UPI0006CB08E7|nr:hypothetical protein [Arthrobacter sp. ERGS1:01]ALE07135.1 hypothetical protein AL755_19410 [Arthrobacter sp. ERGS1:01]